MSTAVLSIAIADDEPLARLRLQQICEDLKVECPNQIVAQFEHGSQLINALPSWAQGAMPDVLLLDINMPGLTGVEIAAFLKKHAPSIAVIFVTAEPQHALAAFEVAAVDYVLKPVREQRLLAALQKVSAALQPVPLAPLGIELPVHDGERTIGLPLAQVLYFKSDTKTTQVRTRERFFSSAQSLAELEIWLAGQPQTFVRVHRNALLRRSAAGEIHTEPECEVQVNGVPERLAVSRRMLPSLRE